MQEQRRSLTRRAARDTALRGVRVARAAAIAVCLALGSAQAQDGVPSVVIDVGDCVNLKSPGERLDCYERHVEAARRPSGASPAPAAQASATPTSTAPRADAVADTSAPAPPLTASAPVSAPAAAAASVAATAVAVAAAPPPQTAPAATATSASPGASPPASSASAPPASAKSPSADNAGFRNQSAREAQPAVPDIVASVSELHETVPNAWQITLDNGQVWRQTIPQRFALKSGQRVTLRGSKWGSSYRLTADTLNGFIQVERVR
jgi:hypothetical protein